MKRIMISVLLVLMSSSVLFAQQKNENEGGVEVTFNQGYCWLDNLSNLSPLGNQYSSDFRKNTMKGSIDISLAKSGWGLKWGVMSFSTYISDKSLNNAVSINYLAIQKRYYFFKSNLADISTVFSLGPIFYRDEVRRANGDKSTLKSTGLGAEIGALFTHEFRNGMSLGLKASEFAGNFFKWRGDDSLKDTNSYNNDDDMNTFGAFGLEAIWTVKF